MKNLKEQSTLDNLVEDLKDNFATMKTEIESIGKNAEWIDEGIEKAEELLNSEYFAHKNTDEIKQNLKDLQDQTVRIKELNQLQKSRIEKLID